MSLGSPLPRQSRTRKCYEQDNNGKSNLSINNNVSNIFVFSQINQLLETRVILKALWVFEFFMSKDYACASPWIISGNLHTGVKRYAVSLNFVTFQEAIYLFLHHSFSETIRLLICATPDEVIGHAILSVIEKHSLCWKCTTYLHILLNKLPCLHLLLNKVI